MPVVDLKSTDRAPRGKGRPYPKVLLKEKCHGGSMDERRRSGAQ